MGFLDKLIGSTEARSDYRKARVDLADVSSAVSDANDGRYLAANRRVIAAEKKLPKWRRGPE